MLMVVKNLENEELRFLVNWLELSRKNLRYVQSFVRTQQPNLNNFTWKTLISTGMAGKLNKNSD